MNPRVIRMVRKSHIVLEVIDIRIPNETTSRMLEDFLKKNKKPFIRVFNKADLVPQGFAQEVVEKKGGIYISSREKHGLRALREKIKQLLGGRSNAIISVIGYPNTGKSSLINCLKGKKSAGVAPTPGHTRGEQLVRMDRNIMLIDTPGVVTSEPEEFLASKGAMAPEKVKNPERAAEILVNSIMKHNKGEMNRVYGVVEQNAYKIFDEICSKRGWKTPERAARKILQDWNSGKIRGYWI